MRYRRTATMTNSWRYSESQRLLASWTRLLNCAGISANSFVIGCHICGFTTATAHHLDSQYKRLPVVQTFQCKAKETYLHTQTPYILSIPSCHRHRCCCDWLCNVAAVGVRNGFQCVNLPKGKVA